jgi:hypothetical protein
MIWGGLEWESRNLKSEIRNIALNLAILTVKGSPICNFDGSGSSEAVRKASSLEEALEKALNLFQQMFTKPQWKVKFLVN